MIEIVVPQFDVNSETVTVIEWLVAEKSKVQSDQNICTVETSKALIDLTAPADGLIVRNVEEGQQLEIGEIIGYIASGSDEVRRIKKLKTEQNLVRKSKDIPKATRKAVELAGKHNVDISTINQKRIITEDDVMNCLRSQGKYMHSAIRRDELPSAIKRVLIITAGVGAMQVIDILLNDPQVTIVGCLDDAESLLGRKIYGVPVVGKVGDIKRLWHEKKFDFAIIALSSKIWLRKKLYEHCVNLGIPMANAIDPTVRINRGCVIGQGNIICSQVHIGTATKIGDNNFISAKTNIDHHNILGSHITFGPNCVLSGLVTVADEVKFGIGVFVEPKLNIGKKSIVASGAVLISSVPENHIVKLKIQSKISLLKSS